MHENRVGTGPGTGGSLGQAKFHTDDASLPRTV